MILANQCAVVNAVMIFCQQTQSAAPFGTSLSAAVAQLVVDACSFSSPYF
jgi:hypothetical protein